MFLSIFIMPGTSPSGPWDGERVTESQQGDGSGVGSNSFIRVDFLNQMLIKM